MQSILKDTSAKTRLQIICLSTCVSPKPPGLALAHRAPQKLHQKRTLTKQGKIMLRLSRGCHSTGFRGSSTIDAALHHHTHPGVLIRCRRIFTQYDETH